MTLVARGTGSADALVPAIKRALWSLNPAVAPYTISTLEGLLDDSLRARRFDMLLLLSFAATALALAAVGVYGLVSHATTERTREIGVRVALGAQAGAVQAMIVRQGVAPALLGVVLGLAGAALLTRVLRGMLFGVTPLDPATYGVVSALLLLIAAVACLAPARRATRVDPAVVLRAE
jgi:ABC-type antimicrobial peptide transport system permease subunit